MANLNEAIAIVRQASRQQLEQVHHNELSRLLDMLAAQYAGGNDWQAWVDRYYEFRREVGSPATRLYGAAGRCLKDIKSHLELISPNTAFQAWDYILSNWTSLSPFLQSQIQPGQMSKYIEEIIMKLNPYGAGKTKQESARIETDRYRRDLENRLAGRAGSPPE